MKLIDKKYWNGIAGFLIAIYIFSLVAAIFHYHSMTILVNETIVSEEKEIQNHFKVIFDNNYECIVQYNLVNLQTSLLVLFSDQQLIASEFFSYTTINCEFCKNWNFLSDNLLRAPPVFS